MSLVAIEVAMPIYSEMHSLLANTHDLLISGSGVRVPSRVPRKSLDSLGFQRITAALRGRFAFLVEWRKRPFAAI